MVKIIFVYLPCKKKKKKMKNYSEMTPKEKVFQGFKNHLSYQVADGFVGSLLDDIFHHEFNTKAATIDSMVNLGTLLFNISRTKNMSDLSQVMENEWGWCSGTFNEELCHYLDRK